MPRLLDLPSELLSLVLEEVGGGELRKDVNKLTICRKWYNAAHAIYLSGRHLRDINLQGCNINRLSDVGSYSGQRHLMHKNTRNLHIRLLGHWRDQTSESDFALHTDDAEGLGHGRRDREELDNDPYVFGERTEWDALRDWRENILLPRLHELAADLPRFTFLESFTFESVSGKQNNGKPLSYYLEGIDFSMLVVGLCEMKGLKHLTLDVCSGISIQNRDDCLLLSQLIPKLTTVRLRLPFICPKIMDLNPILHPTLRPDNANLKSLVIKLYLPTITLGSRNRNADARTMNCLRVPALQNPHEMIEAARKFVVDLEKVRAAAAPSSDAAHTLRSKAPKQGLDLLRISYVDDRGPNIYVIDCLTMATASPVKGWPGSEFFAYEDDGTPWWFEESNADLMWKNEDGSFEVDPSRAATF